MTEKLYLSDTYLARFDATVVEARVHDDRVGLVLDRTAFYPEGGGQPADRGTVGGLQVDDVVEVEGEVLHLVGEGEAPAIGSRVSCAVDWARRFDHVQQHHGQHLLSAALQRLRGAATVSFHLGAETCTIDLDQPPTALPAGVAGGGRGRGQPARLGRPAGGGRGSGRRTSSPPCRSGRTR